MDRKKVVSSNINSIGFDETKSLLEVEFYTGDIWQYHPVTKEIYLTMLASDSVGKEFNRLVKSNESIKSHKMD